MPRSAFRSEVLSAPQGRALFAAAKHYTVGKASQSAKARESGEGWQNSAWDFYDTIGEYRYAVNWVGNLLSRAKLVLMKDGKPTTDAKAQAALNSLFGGPEGQAEMLRQLGIHFTVAGEAYIVGEDGSEEDDWFVVAATEIRRHDGITQMWGEEVKGEHLLIRLWRPHPRKFKKSDSPSRSVLPILSEIEQLTKHVAAQIDSRLAGAGLLLLPSEISFPARQVTTGEGDDQSTKEIEGADAFVDELLEVMSTAIQKRDDASALVPIVLQVPAEALDKIQHLTFWSELDNHAIELRTEAIRRLSLGMDMPPEVLTGTGDMNHWGAWQVDESAIKSHSEPLLSVITSALSTGYLHPFLIAEGVDEEEAKRYSFGADTAGMRSRPNRSKEAVELYDRGELSAEAMRRENGFDENDAPSTDQVSEWFTRKVAGGSTTPELVQAALAALGIQLEVVDGQTIRVQEARPTRSIADHPERGTPDEGALLAAAEQMVWRALERAGNRLSNRMREKPEALAAEVYLDPKVPNLTKKDTTVLLADAWAALERFDYGVPAEKLTEALTNYASDLLTLRKPHDRDALRAHLAKMKEPA